MPEGLVFDLYDDRWRDCWVAATSAVRLRKKQIDFDIQHRVAKLLKDFGPESGSPLSLRIYGTMIKGFCVINNERARLLFCDCERVVQMFTRRPFVEGEDKLCLPATKRPKIEAALTLNLDLARVEASETFDWTQAPLEEGALLRLGGAMAHPEGLVPTIELASQFDVPMVMPEMLYAGARLDMEPGQDAGWLPRLPAMVQEPLLEMAPPDIILEETQPLTQTQPVPEDVAQIVPSEVLGRAAGLQISFQSPPQAARTTELALSSRRRKRQARDAPLGPGVVYGYDDVLMIPDKEWAQQQRESSELSHRRRKPDDFSGLMVDPTPEVDRWGPHLQLLFEPPTELWKFILGHAQPQETVEPPRAEQWPETQELLTGREVLPGQVPPDEMDFQHPQGPPEPEIITYEEEYRYDGGAGAAEAQDARTVKVKEILLAYLDAAAGKVVHFSELMPVDGVDRDSAACTFSALLALASSGELHVRQANPFCSIAIARKATVF